MTPRQISRQINIMKFPKDYLTGWRNFARKHLVALLLIILPGNFSIADEGIIQLIATGTGMAILQINGERMILTPESPSHENVELVSADSEQVTLSIDGETVVLRTDDIAAPILDEDYEPPVENNNPVVLWADSNGSFFANGQVNGKSVKFLVDTGADIVTFSQNQADRLGINYSKSKNGWASTASGVAALKTLKINNLSIDHITMYDVTVSVIMGNFPQFPLLGSSYLNKLDMVRIGNKMELSKR